LNPNFPFITILWNIHVETDTTETNSKPDIIIRDNKKGTLVLLDVVFLETNVIKKVAENVLKCKDFVLEI